MKYRSVESLTKDHRYLYISISRSTIAELSSMISLVLSLLWEFGFSTFFSTENVDRMDIVISS